MWRPPKTVGMALACCLAACAGSEFVAGCPPGQERCGALCVDTSIHPKHCGECNNACAVENGFGACGRGECVFGGCDDDFANCNGDPEDGCEVNLLASRSDCGECGRRCGFAESCVARACEIGEDTPRSLRIVRMHTDGCVATDHNTISGDDRGGIAAGRGRFFYMGDSSAVGMQTTDPTQMRQLSRRDGIFSALGTGQLYSLTSGGLPISREQCSGSWNLDGFVSLDPETLAPVGAIIPLTTPISMPCGGYGSGHLVLPGLDFLMLYGNGRLYEISVPGGQVSDHGSFALPIQPYSCESWAAWGVSERWGGDTYLIYRASNVIARVSLSQRTHTPLLDLSTVRASDLCSFSLDLTEGRWVWHYEGPGGLGGGSESAGSCEVEVDSPE